VDVLKSENNDLIVEVEKLKELIESKKSDMTQVKEKEGEY